LANIDLGYYRNMVAQSTSDLIVEHGAGRKALGYIWRRKDMVILKAPPGVLPEKCLDFLSMKLPVTIDEWASLDPLEKRAMTAIWPSFFT
jgi:hypothetical protein